MAAYSDHGDTVIEVSIERRILIDRIKANREKHIAEYEAALAAWRGELAALVEQIDVSGLFSLPQAIKDLDDECPVSHLRDYDRAIDMFSMCTKDEILMDSDTFNKYCRDEWRWQSSVSRNRFYRRARHL